MMETYRRRDREDPRYDLRYTPHLNGFWSLRDTLTTSYRWSKGFYIFLGLRV